MSDEALFKAIAENVQTGILYFGMDGTLSYANPHALTILSINKDAALGNGWQSHLILEHNLPLNEKWSALIKQNNPFKLNLSMLRASGNSYFQLSCTLLLNAKKTPVGFTGHLSDVTQETLEKVKFESDSKESKSLIEDSRIAYIEREKDNQITYINPAFTRLFGYTLSDIKESEDWYTKAYPDKNYREKIKSNWNAYIKNYQDPKSVLSLEARIYCKDGSIKYVLVSPTKLLGSSNDKFAIRFHDITELKLAQISLLKSQERFALAIRGSGVGIWDWNIETNHVFFSPEFKQELGYDDTELPDEVTSFYKHLHPDDKDTVQNAFRSHISHLNTPFHIKYRMRHKDGSYHWYQGVGQALKSNNGHAYRMAGSHKNITQQKQDHDKLTLAKMVFDHSGEAIITTDCNGYIQAINPAFSLITGFESEEIIHQHLTQLRGKKNTTEHIEKIINTLNETGTWYGEIWVNHKNTDEIALSIMINAIKDKSGKIKQFIALFTDITEKKKTQEIIWQQAHYDDLTQLLNRNSFTKFINSAVNGDNPFALLFIDLDHFKQINDTLGHKVGDELLKQAAFRIKRCVRNSDVVSRFGGDEFTVILSGLINENIITRICSQIILNLSAPFDLFGEDAYISASIGITQFPHDSESVEELYKFADQAMYEAKRNGRNRFSFFTQALQIAANEQREITADMRIALNNNEFQVLYQPIINLIDNRIYKAEALLRWHQPKRGIVSPYDFIPIAEETGMINEIGDWVFKQAAMQAKIWRKYYDPNFQISINKSPVQFYSNDERSHERWSQFLNTINLSGTAISVEITEGLLLDSSPIVIEKLLDFQSNGISISLDDFGTGYSALSYLKKFNINFIKIDKSFVTNLNDDQYDRVLCETIISMAHKLGMKVIAEGIETEMQKDFLIKAGCDYGQGYLFSTPITAEALSNLMKQNQS